MTNITQRVFEMYQEYPFPGNVEYKMDYSLPMLLFFTENAPKGRESLLEKANIMEAGCGTGNTLIKLAESYSESTFTGVDMTTNSLKIARENAAQKGLKNIVFIEENILNLDLSKKFNVLFCIGVLHHLEDMNKGLENLVKHIEDNGYLVLWLYGKYGRFRLNLNQFMLETLFKNVDPLKEKVRLTKKVLQKSKNLMECHFNVPNSEIEDKWTESLDFVLHNDAWLVDQFLHYNEKTMDMKDILALADCNNLELVFWSNVSMNIKKYIADDEISSIYEKLENREKMLVLDYLLKPKYYYIALKKQVHNESMKVKD
jgi:2-polyprenyl-3-methyl-5-hydroxy-6-metoxy-1,4-benzoquinol methylase